MLEATFNRPEDNGVSDGMARELSAALAVAHETSDMVLLRSIGPDFCTGRLRDPDAGPPHPEAYSRRPEYDSIFYCYHAIRDAPVPWSLLSKAAAGLWHSGRGCCDVSFASSNAQFNIPEMTHKVMPTMIMSALYDRMNRNAIMWMTYSAECIDAQQAMMYGIVNRAVDADSRMRSQAFARRSKPTTPWNSWSQGIFAIRATHGFAGRARLRAAYTQ